MYVRQLLEPVNRRKIISTLTIGGFVGCIKPLTKGASNDSQSTIKQTESMTPTSTDENGNPPKHTPKGQRTVNLSGDPFDKLIIKTVPDDVPFTPDVNLLEQPSDGHAGILEIELTNQDERAWIIRTSMWKLPFTSSTDTNDMLQVSHVGPTNNEPPCARGEIVDQPSTDRQMVRPQGQIVETRKLYAVHQDTPCYPNGEFEFNNFYMVDQDQEKGHHLGFHWGFILVSN